jgi:hypothetical protein
MMRMMTTIAPREGIAARVVAGTATRKVTGRPRAEAGKSAGTPDRRAVAVAMTMMTDAVRLVPRAVKADGSVTREVMPRRLGVAGRTAANARINVVAHDPGRRAFSRDPCATPRPPVSIAAFAT